MGDVARHEEVGVDGGGHALVVLLHTWNGEKFEPLCCIARKDADTSKSKWSNGGGERGETSKYKENKSVNMEKGASCG